jgi:hypothetical protein
VFAIIIISRLLLIGNGLGTDGDGWRLVKSGFWFAKTGIYEPSRFPGYPLPEFFYGIVYLFNISDFGIINLFTTLVFMAGLFYYYKILKDELKTSYPLLIITAFAFTPIIFVNSIATMDYIWSLSFIIISFYYLLKGNYNLSGILLGLASGCRPTAIILLIPYFYYIKQVKGNYFNKQFIRLTLLAVIISLIIYSPLIVKYGLSFLTTYPSNYPSVLVILGRIFIKNIGLPGTAALFVFSFMSIYSSKSCEPYQQNKTIINTCVLIIAVFLFLFFKLPSGGAYLIPAIPFLFIILYYLFPGRLFISFCLLVILSSFLFNYDAQGLKIKGPVLIEVDKRAEEMNYLKQFYSNINKYSDTTIVLAESFNPKIELYGLLNNLKIRANILLKDGLSKDSLIYYQKKNYGIYYLKGIDKNLKEMYGYSLSDYGIREININF